MIQKNKLVVNDSKTDIINLISRLKEKDKFNEKTKEEITIEEQ